MAQDNPDAAGYSMYGALSGAWDYASRITNRCGRFRELETA